jgi:DtxR family Mn-dependent transcriptional regulator
MTTRASTTYLRAILAAGGAETLVPTTVLARRIGVAPASVTGMLRRLSSADPPLVDYLRGRGARLTHDGRMEAMRALRHHRLLERYLCDALGFAWDEVHAEAERLEHGVSDALGEKLASHLGNPGTDPHGHPIPTREGALPPRAEIPLPDLPPGVTASVSSVEDSDPAALRSLAAAGIVPSVSLVVTAAREGRLLLRVGNSPATCAVDLDVAGRVSMCPPAAVEGRP